MNVRCIQRGVTLVELLVSLAISSMLLVGLYQLVSVSFTTEDELERQSLLVNDARFALSRMVQAAAATDYLMIPQQDNTGTALEENVRQKTVGEFDGSAVLAMSIGPTLDLDGDGIPDADNDGDGRINEDLPGDINFDGEPGVRGFDDDGNGSTDFIFSPDEDDDESNDRRRNEDPANGLDDDGDGLIDEDPDADNNGDGAPGIAGVDDDGDGLIDEGDVDDDDEDGRSDEDWYDTLVFYLDDDALVERRATPYDTNGDGTLSGRDFIETRLIDGVSYLGFERLPALPAQQELLRISLELTDSEGNSVSLETQVRVGARR